MGDSLRDYYHKVYQKASPKARKALRTSYAAYEGRAGDPTLHSRWWTEKTQGYRPPASQQRLNLDG